MDFGGKTAEWLQAVDRSRLNLRSQGGTDRKDRGALPPGSLVKSVSLLFLAFQRDVMGLSQLLKHLIVLREDGLILLGRLLHVRVLT